MPFTGWVIFLIIAMFAVLLGVMVGFMTENESAAVITSVLLTAIVLCVMLFWYNGTESGKREWKSWKSETNQGIQREVKVYDVNGNLIKEYKGKFDVDYDSDRIIFDDQDGKRHIVYYPTGTVIIDEI